MKRIFAAVLLAGLLACGKAGNDKDAIRQAVVEHLSARKGLDLDVAKLDIAVTALNIRENAADATVSFTPKSGGGGMTMQYQLERAGGKWSVKGKAEGGANPHGDMQAPPEGATLPPGHPAVPPAVPPAK